MHTKDDVFYLSGLALLNIQTVEKGLKVILTFIARDIQEIDFDDPYNWIKKTKMLGPLIGLLKKTMDLGNDFQTTLEKFISERNKLVHHFFEHYDLDDQESLNEARLMIINLLEITHQVGSVLRAFAVANEERLGLDASEKNKLDRDLEIEEHFLRDIDKHIQRRPTEETA